jgi:phenylacetaldehyde dehydrogenase
MNAAIRNPQVAEFLAKDHRLLIGGDWVPASAGNVIDVYDPAQGNIIARAPGGKAADVDRAVKAARKAFDSEAWWGLGPQKRGKILWQLADLVERNIEELAELESMNNGLSFGVIKGFSLPHVVETFRYYAGWTTKIHGRTSELIGGPLTALGYTLREPIGVVGLITPWNAPLLLAGWQLAPALAAGCTCVLKPAEETPLSALRLGELMIEAGVPNGVVNIVTGLGAEAGAALAAHPDVDKISFTGSTQVGRLILAAASGNLKKVALELGGKSPVIVLADADKQKAIAGAARAIFNNAGQVCSAGSRLFVQRAAFDEVVDGISTFAKSLKLGSGLDSSSQMGPLISAKHLERVAGYVKSGEAEGARVVTGGRRSGQDGYFFEPTILTDTKPDMHVAREEIFGPVLTANPIDDAEEGLAAANNTTFGLAASIWTSNVERAHKLARSVKAGSIGINCHSAVDVSMPRGGYKQSGWGRENGPEGLDAYLETKSVFVNLG